MNRQSEAWKKLRGLAGAGPLNPVFPTRRRHLKEMQPGERLLLIRKLGGLGDILQTTALFPELFEQYPNIEVVYAVPPQYLELFEGHETKLQIIPYDRVYGPVGDHYGPESIHHTAGIQNWALEEFDLIEDISSPCANWERLQVKYGFQGLKWRNRMDRWSRWIGLELRETPETIIRFTHEELKKAEKRIRTTDKPVVIWSPISAGRNRSYPWYREVKAKLEEEGAEVWYLHPEKLGTETLTSLSLRQMGAFCAVADYIITMDTSTFHWGGLLRRPTLGLFNLLLGTSHAKYYPTAKTIQFCDTPCISSRYDYKWRERGTRCEKWYNGPTPKGHLGQELALCFHPESFGEIVKTYNAMREEACATVS